MNSTKLPVLITVNFISHTKWLLVLDAKDQAISDNPIGVCDYLQVF